MNRSIILGAIIISAAILVNGFLERRAHVAVSTSPVATPSEAARDHMIAVLAFTSLSSADPDNSLAAGIQREIITRLAAQHIKAASVQEAPRTGELLLGSIQRAGNRVRINVQLVDAASRVPRWAQTYDRELTDVFALESEIAENVAKSVAAKKRPNKALEPTASRRTIQLCMSSIRQSAATRAIARGGSSRSR